MSLTARQERDLHGIEMELLASDPRMASMFDIFTRLASDDGPPEDCEELPKSRHTMPATLRLIVLFVIVITLLVTTAVLTGTVRENIPCSPLRPPPVSMNGGIAMRQASYCPAGGVPAGVPRR